MLNIDKPLRKAPGHRGIGALQNLADIASALTVAPASWSAALPLLPRRFG